MNENLDLNQSPKVSKIKSIAWIEKHTAELRLYLLAVIAVLLLFMFIGKIWPTRYEYKAIAIPVEEGNKFSPNRFHFEVIGAALKEYKGWELVSAVCETETVHPNFGRSDLVTGLQPNTRTGRIVLLFKRKTVF